MPEESNIVIENPIINSPYHEPAQYWKISPHDPPEKINGRRPPTYFYTTNTTAPNKEQAAAEIEIHNIATIRQRLHEWRTLALRGEGGVSRITMELLNYWRRDGRAHPLFFAQLEAVETIIFLNEARGDFLQNITIPPDAPADGGKALNRLCCKMATGAGKTTVMAMLAAWSILNKVNNKSDRRFAKAVLVVCPNVTIRQRLAELNPQQGDASIYRTRDLVPPLLMPQLAQGRVLTTNWHVFEPQQSGSARVVKAGKRVVVKETVHIGAKTATLRGKRYLREQDLRKHAALGLLTISSEKHEKNGALKSAEIEREKYVESDAALVRRVLSRELGEQRDIFVFNDEAHHAYRLYQDDDNDSDNLIGDDEDDDNYYKQATVWVEGLDKINAKRGIKLCVDFSATPYFLGRAGDDVGRVFPWTVSNFSLQDAIESGLVKVPQLAARDNSGDTTPGYFNIWKWLLPKLTSTERGGGKSQAKPEAVLKYAHTPLAMLAGMWEEERRQWEATDEKRPPVFIIVCKTTALAKAVYEWIADNKPPTSAIPPANLTSLQNRDSEINTIRVDSKVQGELESGNTKGDENRWMRHVLDTVGKREWKYDLQRRILLPDGFRELAKKLGREKFLEYPPGRDVRCIVSVGMLTEGWDCNTVTHIIGLRPFMSQLLCEQVIGRGLRRVSYETGDDGLMNEEVATVLGVPLSTFPIKANSRTKKEKKETFHIRAVPGKEKYKIIFPRVEGYRQHIKRRVVCNIAAMPMQVIDSTKIPQEVELAAGLASNQGRVSLNAPGERNKATLDAFRKQMRLQQSLFEMTLELVKQYADSPTCEVPREALFPQLFTIVHNYIHQKVTVTSTSNIKDAFLSPYYGYIIEQLRSSIRSADNDDEAPELPRYEVLRGAGSTSDVDFHTKREPYPVIKSHLNAVVPDTKRLEQSTAYRLDQHKAVAAFVKNEGMGFGIPYIHNGETHDYLPDFIVRLQTGEREKYLILETKGYDEKKEVKTTAAKRWCNAVNADEKYGEWEYAMIEKSDEVDGVITAILGLK